MPSHVSCIFVAGALIAGFAAASTEESAGRQPAPSGSCGLPAYSDPAPEGLPNVLLIAVDTLRADRLGLYGHGRETSQHVDRLAQDALVFDHAIAPAPWTTPSFAGIFTGRHPGELGIGYDPLPLPDQVPTWAEELKSRGYATAGIVSHFFIGTKYRFQRGFDFWNQRHSGGHATVSSDGVSTLALDCLNSLHQSGRPFFLFAHFFDPHYDYLSHYEFPFYKGYKGELHSGGDNFEELRAMARKGELTEEDRKYLLDLYDSEIAFTDSRIGLLLEALRAKKLYDDTMIIFLADHGEMFGQRKDRWVGHTQFLFEELVRVPLIIKLPKRDGSPQNGRVGETVSLVDLMPSVLQRIDPSYEAPKTLWPNADLQAPEHLVFSQTRRWRELDAVYEGTWKLVLDRKTGRPLLYDLESDPAEQRNVAGEQPERLERMREHLDLWQKAAQLKASQLAGRAAPELSEEELDKLRSLGYIR